MSLLDTASLVVTPNGTKASKLYSVVPSDGAGDLSVTRATTATRVNSAGLIESVASNVPRLDYTNGTCPSILVEPQRTNLITYSQQFDNADWIKIGATVTPNTAISPDGSLNADTISFSTGSNIQQIFFLNGVVTCSLYAKYIGTQWLFIENYNNADLGAWFDIQNGVVGTVISGVTANIENAGNGWYRCSITMSATNIFNSIFAVFNTTSNGGFARTGSSYFWGAQLEAGSYATSYIPTTSASVTRNADVINKSGISSLIGQTEGTLFIEEIYDSTAMNSGGLDDTLISLTDGSSSNLISIFHYGGGVGTILFFIRLSNTTQVAISSPASSSGIYKIALAYKNNDVVAYINGTQIGTDTSASIPTTSVVTFVDPVTTNSATKTVNIKSSALWKTRLTNTQLAQLTTI
jgi:hypothetical protein